ncbi:unnamed protein product [Protopolystoma xenopodis]|uniref:RH1 domain-containing protein n=1 Tax=Protopolystoma xenopodis TaxID=117903 RepID=A0A3S5CKS0_9PLAT|nr:unnamed protein product [Protopolystoma xenopodis]
MSLVGLREPLHPGTPTTSTIHHSATISTTLGPPFITVLDVYDVAAAIGKDFETIIDKYGPDSITNLMPKVISVLEELEDYATRFESEDREIITLQAAVERLEAEKNERAEDQSRYEKVQIFNSFSL